MVVVNKTFKNINLKEFKRYLLISIIFIVTLILVSNYDFTQARYESNITATSSPNIAFFIVDVGSQTGQIELEGIVPREEKYIYCFSVSNFNNSKHADVDLTYNIEIITTTNLPLEYTVYSDSDLRNEILDGDTIIQNSDGVYFRHLIINDTESMAYEDDVTNYYYLVVDFDISYSYHHETLPGLIELIDIRINAEQDVSSW